MIRARLALLVVASSLAIASSARADDKACMSAAAKGQELRDEGKLLEAKPFFQQCADSACPAPIPGYCTEWLADLSKKMPSIVFRATDEGGHDVADASVEIDGKRTVAIDGRPVDVDPGKHTLKITRAGKRPYEDVVVVAQSEKDRVYVAKLVAAGAGSAGAPVVADSKGKDDAPKSGVPVASWISWGIGGAALLSFIGFGAKARFDYDDYESRCGSRCADSERDTVQTSVTIADVSLVVAIVAAGVGTFFYLTRPTPSSAPKAATR